MTVSQTMAQKKINKSGFSLITEEREESDYDRLTKAIGELVIGVIASVATIVFLYVLYLVLIWPFLMGIEWFIKK